MFWDKQWRLLLLAILTFAFLTRIYRLYIPEGYYFDEIYHASTAKLIAHNDPQAFEWDAPAPEPNTAVDWLHPPLAKYTQAFFMLVFGETSFAWRFSSVLFGVGVIFLTFHLADRLFVDKHLALLAASLASLDGLLLVQSRIAMNDIHVTFFILLSLLFYMNYRQAAVNKTQMDNSQRWLFATGCATGLAMGSKWSGIFVLPIIAANEIFFFLKIKKSQRQFKKIWRSWLLKLLAFFILPLVIYVLSYTQMFLQGKSLFCFQHQAIRGECYFGRISWHDHTLWEGYWSHFAELHRQIFHYQTHLTATHAYQSRPWQWFTNMRPVWYWVEYGSNSRADIYAQGNTVLYWAGAVAIIYTVLYLLKELLAKSKNQKKEIKNFLSLFFLLSSYLFVWLPWQFSPRIMFFYHYTPAVPFLCILLAYWLLKLWHKRKSWSTALVIILCVLIVENFVLFYPNWTGLPVSLQLKDSVYFFFDSWK